MEEGEERQGVHLRGGGQGRVRSWPGEEEGKGSRGGRGQRSWEGQPRRRAGPWWSRKRSGLRGWLVEEGEGQAGYSILGWWRAGR